MKNLKKLVAVLLAVVMVMSFFIGCTNNEKTSKGNENTTTGENTDTQPKDPLKEHVEISLGYWGAGQTLPEDGKEDAVRDALYKKLNITLKPINLTWDDYQQKIQIWAASSQLPDLFVIDAISTVPNNIIKHSHVYYKSYILLQVAL